MNLLVDSASESLRVFVHLLETWKKPQKQRAVLNTDKLREETQPENNG